MKNWMLVAPLAGLLLMGGAADAAPHAKKSGPSVHALKNKKKGASSEISPQVQAHFDANKALQAKHPKPLPPGRNMLNPHWGKPLSHAKAYDAKALVTYAQGRLESGEDGSIRLVLPISKEQRQARARARGGVNLIEVLQDRSVLAPGLRME